MTRPHQGITRFPWKSGDYPSNRERREPNNLLKTIDIISTFFAYNYQTGAKSVEGWGLKGSEKGIFSVRKSAFHSTFTYPVNGVENDSVHAASSHCTGVRRTVLISHATGVFRSCYTCRRVRRRRPVDNAESRCRRHRNICIIIIITKRNYAAIAVRARVVRNGEILGWR